MSPEFIFRPMFDDVRSFIRHDIGKPGRFVQITPPPKSSGLERPSQDHVLALSWEEDDKGHILGFVRLFGFAEYIVRLAKSPTGVWLEIGSAHAYKLENRSVIKAPQGRFVRPAPPVSRTSGIIARNPE
jgi:hypothetical protein